MRLVLKFRTILSLACKSLTVVAALLFVGDLSAHARPRHAHSHSTQAKQSIEPCLFLCSQPEKPALKSSRRAATSPEQSNYAPLQAAAAGASSQTKDTVVGDRPAGCPSRWCGCQASLELFGRIIPALNKAATWLKTFPHVALASASPEMAAVRGHNHVVVLKQHVAGDRWVVKDGNWGGRTHIRETSLSGYTVVDPRGGKLAMN